MKRHIIKGILFAWEKKKLKRSDLQVLSQCLHMKTMFIVDCKIFSYTSMYNNLLLYSLIYYAISEIYYFTLCYAMVVCARVCIVYCGEV